MYRYRQRTRCELDEHQQEEREQRAEPPANHENRTRRKAHSEKTYGQRQNDRHQNAQRQRRTPAGKEKTRKWSGQPSQRPSRNQLKLAPQKEREAAGQTKQPTQPHQERENRKN